MLYQCKKWIAGLMGLWCMLAVCGCANSMETAGQFPQNAAEGQEINISTKESNDVEENAVIPDQENAGIDTEADIPVEENADTEAKKAEEEEPEKVDRTLCVSLAGDCSLGRLSVHGYEGTFYEMYDLYGASYFFKNVESIFKTDDMTLVNFEGVLTESNEMVEKDYQIKGEPEYNQILVEAGIEAVSFGNNHRIDYGQQGIDDTIVAFNEVNVSYAYDENLGIYETENGIRVGFVSVNEVYDKKGVEVFLEQGIAKLHQEGVDFILACCHWGEECHHYPEEYQKELGRKCIDWGADLVVGSHPHVLQGIDYYNGKFIIYSLGNFCFGGNKNPKDKNTMIVQAEAHINANGVKDEFKLTVIPCTISSVEDRNDYCPTIADGEKREEILRQVNKYSSGFSVGIAEDGTVYRVE